METRKYECPLGGDKTSTKYRWIGPKGQAALALAVSLWIAGGSMASAAMGLVYIDANDNIVKGGSISGTATAVPGFGNLASDKILTLTNLLTGDYYGGKGTGEVNGYQLILDNANISMGSAIGGYSTATNNAENNFVKIKNSNVAWVFGGLSDGHAKKNTVELINSTATTVTGGTGNGGYATDNSVYMTDSKVTETVKGGG